MSWLDGARDLLSGAATRTTVFAKLTAMAAMFNLRPSLRHHLRGAHPLGEPYTLDATIEFVTWDRQAGVHVVFGGGKMRVRRGPARRADTTVRFRGDGPMRAFFAGEDSFNMLLDNRILLGGNLNYLFQFAHLSAVLTHGRDPLPARPTDTGRWPEDWRELEAPGVGAPCPTPPAGEVEFLGDPHLADRSLDDFPRIKRLLWAFRTTRPAFCVERPRLWTEHKLRARSNGGASDPPVLRQARALHHLLAHKRPIIHADDLLAGTTTSKRIGVVVFPELGGLGMWPELLTMPARELNPYDITREEVEILDREVFPFWMDDNVREWTKAHADDRRSLELDERFVLYFLWKTQAVSHTVIDLPRALDRGLDDLVAEARERETAADSPKRRDFYRALRIALEGVLLFAGRLADHAEALLESEQPSGPEGAARREMLAETARICRKVPARPPETLHEAIQALWILFLCQHQENMGAGLVVGRLDTWLGPYLRADLAGAQDPAERRRVIDRSLELVCALMLKLTDHLPMVPDVGNRLFGGSSENQVITIAGLTADGGDAVNDMTWLLLKATEMLRLKDPNVNARFAPGVNSEAYLRRLCEVNRLTRATPSLHNDDAIVPALEAQGLTTEHARDWTATGCVEPTSCGRHFGHTNCMMMNMVAPLEMALRDGVHPVLRERIGPRTGAAECLNTFEAFLGAYEEQLAWLIARSTEGNNLLGRAHQVLKPSPLLSALFDGPMERGIDVTEGGARYNTSGAALIGLADVVDSLCAIQTLVFEEQRLTLPEFVAALEADFEGHEQLHARILRRTPHFGQDHPLPAALVERLQAFAFHAYQGQPHYRGGRYVPGYWSMSNHVAFGLLSGALPSGRRRGKPFTPGLTPSHTSGASLTDQIHTVAALDGTHMPNNIAFNVKVVPGGDDTPETVVDRMCAYVGSFFDLGGMQLQFNVTSSETLRAAMANPEDYGDLLVRISGYNAYFVELNRDIQREVIERAEHTL